MHHARALVLTALALLSACAVAHAGDQPPLIDTPDKARAAQAACAAALGKPAQWTNTIGMTFQLIPPGQFDLGGTDADAPLHRVTITKPFYMATHEVTQKHWRQVVGTVHSTFHVGDDKPINCIRYYDLITFATKLAKLDNIEKGQPTYRAPTEAEWEYAARAGATNQPQGSDLDAIAWTIRNSANTTHPVATRAANAFGLHDMLGNVWEWCADLYDADYYTIAPTADPTGPTKDLYGYHVLRGGSAMHGPLAARYCNRAFFQGSRTEQHIGFRIVLPLE